MKTTTETLLVVDILIPESSSQTPLLHLEKALLAVVLLILFNIENTGSTMRSSCRFSTKVAEERLSFFVVMCCCDLGKYTPFGTTSRTDWGWSRGQFFGMKNTPHSTQQRGFSSWSSPSSRWFVVTPDTRQQNTITTWFIWCSYCMQKVREPQKLAQVPDSKQCTS